MQKFKMATFKHKTLQNPFLHSSTIPNIISWYILFIKKHIKNFQFLSKFNGKIPAIDLIHDTRHLCTRLRTDGIKAMSRGFSGGKQVKKSANTSNRGRVVYSRQNKMKNFFS